jgi:hypothetical protein
VAAKPGTLPRWARTAGGVDASNLATPSSGEQDAGWANGQNPVSSSKMNWLFNWLYQWAVWLNDSPAFTTVSSNVPGLSATGNGTGSGLVGTGGATNASGVRGVGGATNGLGVDGQGAGSSAGVQGTGGTTGRGGNFIGGATSGDGVLGTGTGGGNGVAGQGQGAGKGGSFTGGATGDGVVGTGGATSGSGGTFSGVAGNGNGVNGTGQGSGKGGSFTAGATGIGVAGVGGATSGDGVTGTGTAGNSRGGNFSGQGTAEGVLGTGGATGAPGVKATAGSGNTRGSLSLTGQASPSAPSDGDMWYDTTLTPNNIKGRIAGKTSSTPTTISANSGWTAGDGAGVDLPRYSIDACGYVHLSGCLRADAGAAGGSVTAITLPAGYRPGVNGAVDAVRWRFVILNVTGGVAAWCSVQTTGTVDILTIAGGNPTTNNVYRLDSVSFLAGN